MRANSGAFKPAVTGVSRASTLLLAGFVLCGLATRRTKAQDQPPPTDSAAVEFFETRVRPVLAERCWSCHGPEKAKNSLRLDSRASIVAGGDTGPAIVAGQPDESLIIQALRYDDLIKMPPKGKLPDSEIEALERWVQGGAIWPAHSAESASKAGGANPQNEFDLEARAGFWSFQPVRPLAPPEVADRHWPLTSIDRFVLAKLEGLGMAPAPQADRLTLIRRLYFDLIGLPPKPLEVAAFLTDTRPDAYERLVDRLLASPHYGERWGRHWLDLVRYVETSGHEFDYDIPFAWRYRDYMIRALNDDVPYNAIVTEHLAGDLLDKPRTDVATGNNESVVATTFLWFGDGSHSPVDVRDEQLRRLDGQIDVIGKAFLGLTVACARCHDHKFDAVSQRDYYALAGFLKSTHYSTARIDGDGDRALARQLRENSRAHRAPIVVGASGAAEGEGVVFASFDGSDYGAWRDGGAAFEGGPSRPGDARVLSDGTALPVRAGLAHSGLGAELLQGTLRSPTFTIENKYIHYLVAGRKSRIELVVDGFEKIRDPIYGGLARDVNHGDELRWITQDVSMWLGHRASIAFIDGSMPDFRTGTVIVDAGGGYIAVDEVRFSDSARANAGDASTSGVLDLATSAAADASTIAQRRALLAALRPPQLALAACDGTTDDEHMLPRGNARKPGERVSRRFLEALGGTQQPLIDEGSGRLRLASQIASESNPLFARVAVNRVWQHHLGRGLVASSDDFGRMGQAPTHPELLDWLANEFEASGYSLKHLHRLILFSRTYQMDSESTDQADSADPDNRWLHRANVRRLDAEAIRDTILALSGQLKAQLYGPSVPPYLSEFMEGRGRPAESGPLDGAGRRTIYLNMRRNFLPPLLLAFDLPTAASTMGVRNVSNVPAQALSLLNDPFVAASARAWAARLLAAECDDNARIELAFREALGRAPARDEIVPLEKLISDRPGSERFNAWTDICLVMFNLKELLFIP